MVIPLISAPYISRVLGRVGVGVYSYTNSIQIYFALFAALGTLSYGTKVISQNRNNKKEYSKQFWEIEIITVISTLVLISVWLLFTSFAKEYRIIYVILSLNILAVLFDISWLYAGLEKFIYRVSVNLFFKLVQLFLLFIFVKKASDVPVYVGIIATTNLLGTISMWLFLPKEVEKTHIRDLRPLRHLKELWIYFIPTIATTIYTTLDKTLIGVITGNESENGYYEQASQIIHAAESLTFSAVNMVLSSRNAFLFSEERTDEIKSKISSTMDYISFMGIGICFGILGVSDRFVPLYFGTEFEKSALLLKVFSPIVFIIGISNCLGGQYYTPSGKRSQSAKYIVIGAITNGILNVIFITFFKSLGAVIASIVAELVISILYIVNCDGYYSFKSLLVQSWKKILSGILMLIIVTLIDKHIANNLLALIADVSLGITLYTVLLILLKDGFVFTLVSSLKKGEHYEFANKH